MLGGRLEEARKNAGMTRAELGAACGMNDRMIGFYEREDRSPDPKQLRRLCRALNISADYLLGLSDQPASLQHNDEAIRPEQLQEISGITDTARMIARFDLAAEYPRDCLPECSEILSKIMELQSKVDDLYQNAKQQHPAFDLAFEDEDDRRNLRIRARSGDPEALDFIAGEDYFEQQTRWTIEHTAGEIFDLLAVDLFNDFRDKIGADVPVFHRIITTGQQADKQ